MMNVAQVAQDVRSRILQDRNELAADIRFAVGDAIRKLEEDGIGWSVESVFFGTTELSASIDNRWHVVLKWDIDCDCTVYVLQLPAISAGYVERQLEMFVYDFMVECMA